MKIGLKQKQHQICDNSRGHSSIGRAPALQAGGCGFESHCLHFYLRLAKFKNVIAKIAAGIAFHLSSAEREIS